MSWLRYSDDWTTDRAWDGISYEARWHYMTMVEECSQARRWDGRLPVTRALRTSDVADPDKCIHELAANGWVDLAADTVTIVLIDDHVPPEGQRDENLLPRKARNQAAYRLRRCERGEHSRYCPRSCPAKRVTARVTGNTGTGRDGTVRETLNEEKQEEDVSQDDDPWDYSRPIGGAS